MSHWLDAAKLFEENSKEGNYFEAQSGIYALKRIQTFLETTFPQMFFLLGEPGSGKSFMLHHLYRLYAPKRLCVLIENPFLTPEQLLERLLACLGIKKESGDLEDLRIKAIEAYSGVEHLIMLDEGQLLSPNMREFVRILSDSKVFYFLIAMHKNEGEDMLMSPHFRSRPHQVVYLQDLGLDECVPYLSKELKSLKKINIRELFNKSLVEKSWNYSKGNFRNFKKCYYHLFLLLDYAHTHNKKEFLKPNMTLLRMAAIRSGLLASEANNSDFEQLLKEAKKDKPLLLSLGLGALLLVGAFLSWWMLDKALDTKELKKPTVVVEEVEKIKEGLVGKIEEKYIQAESIEKNETIKQEDVVLEKESEVRSHIEILTTFSEDEVLPSKNSEIKTEEILDVSNTKEALPLKMPHLPLSENPVKNIYVEPYPNQL